MKMGSDSINLKGFPNMTVTREDVIWCYQNLLGRNAESEAAINSHLVVESVKDLVVFFVHSAEFNSSASAKPEHTARQHIWLRADEQTQLIETSATHQELDQCAAVIKEAWQAEGRTQAHFSVLSSEEFLPTNLARSIDSFWASGEAEAVLATRILARHGVANLAERVCVEYGCGVGRVTNGFARLFKTVHGYDISEPHLVHARQHTAEVGLKNIVYHECLEMMKTQIEPCDFFYSAIVFQHNPPPVIMELIRRALASLRPGGVAIFQVPTFIADYQFKLKDWLEAGPGSRVHMHCVPQAQIIECIFNQGCKLLEIREDGFAGSPDTIISNTFVVRRPV
jgi:2-polyprenyl-3-methyl-5-hydroxy-6-metoxy-1,4-benzoquinol methylase